MALRGDRRRERDSGAARGVPKRFNPLVLNRSSTFCFAQLVQSLQKAPTRSIDKKHRGNIILEGGGRWTVFGQKHAAKLAAEQLRCREKVS